MQTIKYDTPRWISRDPAGEAIGINLYAYVGNSPIIFADPLGLWQVTIAGGFGGFGGIITFGKNNGQWNVGAYGGLGAGLDVDINGATSETHCKGFSGGVQATGGIGLGDHIGGSSSIGSDGSSADVTGNVDGVRGGYGTEGWTGPSFGGGFGAGTGIGLGGTYYF